MLVPKEFDKIAGASYGELEMLGEWRNCRGAGPVIACKFLWGKELSRVGGLVPDAGLGDANSGLVPGTDNSRLTIFGLCP